MQRPTYIEKYLRSKIKSYYTFPKLWSKLAQVKENVAYTLSKRWYVTQYCLGSFIKTWCISLIILSTSTLLILKNIIVFVYCADNIHGPLVSYLKV